jgi:hypothetical protein
MRRARQSFQPGRRLRFTREREPEGLGEAVGAAALMLTLMTAITAVGFAWARYEARSAHAFAVWLVQHVAVAGSDADLPAWSGFGKGPEAGTAADTFEAVHRLGAFTPRSTGSCRMASNFALCGGNRYSCRVFGDTPAGVVEASVGVCDGRSGRGYSFDLLDFKIPLGPDPGNRDAVDADRDGTIRYGSSPLLQAPLQTRSHAHPPAGPFRW